MDRYTQIRPSIVPTKSRSEESGSTTTPRATKAGLMPDELSQNRSILGSIKLGSKTGPQAFLSVARRLGFGSKTGLPLIGEASWECTYGRLYH